MKHLLIALIPALALAQPTQLRVLGTTPTQVIVSYVPPSSSDCTIAATHDGLAAHDTNNSLFAGSNSDPARKIEDTGRRIVVVGARKAEASGGKIYSRALPADTDITITVTCGSAASVTARTARINGLVPEALSSDPDNPGRWLAPSFIWGVAGKETPVIDHQTGTKIWRLTDPSETGFSETRTFSKQIATGWTNPTNLLSDSTSTRASISGTSPAYLFFQGTASGNAIGGYAPTWYSAHNVDIRINGFGDNETDTNRQVNVCLVKDSQNCIGNTLTVTLPQSTPSSQYVNPSYPLAGYAGWGAVLKRNDWPHGLFEDGSLSVSGNNATIGYTGGANYSSRTFNLEWPTGTKIQVTGSSPTCTDNLCTVNAVASNTALTFQESLSLTDVTWTSQNVGVKIWKTNSTGTIELSAGYRLAGQYEMQVAPNDSCHPIPVSVTKSAAGVDLGYSLQGRLCKFNDYGMGNAERLYWISDSTPDFRLVSLFRVPGSVSGHTSSDLPDILPGYSKTSNSSFDKDDGRVLWTATATPNGTAIFKLTWSGDGTALAPYKWGSGGIISSDDNQITWLNVTKGGTSLSAQVTALPGWNSDLWGSPNLSFRGVTTTGRAIFVSLNNGQDFAGWVFSFDLATSVLEQSFQTFNAKAFMTPGGIHGITAASDVSLPIHGQYKNNADKNMGGPFTGTISHVKRSGSWNDNTALTSTYTANNADATCPSDIAQEYKDLGATGDNCVQVRILAEPCSAVATTAEKTAHPCTGDATKAGLGVPLAPGMAFQDISQGEDNEFLLIVKRDTNGTPSDVTDDTLWLLRDSFDGYACQQANPRGRLFAQGGTSCVANTSQAAHSDNWQFRVVPNYRDFVWEPVSNTFKGVSNALMRGHYDIASTGSGNHSMIGNSTGPQGSFAALDKPFTDYGNTLTPNWISNAGWFAGIVSDGLPLQSYPHTPASVGTGIWAKVGTDMRHINPSLGTTGEAQGQGVGSNYTVTLVGGTTRVYKVSAITGTFSRVRPLWVWAGDTVFDEKSSATTGNTLTDSDIGRFCYALNGGECRSGSSAGDVYIVQDKINTAATQCNSSQSVNRIPCVFSSTGNMGKIIQMRLDANDPGSAYQRAISNALTAPAQQYTYMSARDYPAGRKVLSFIPFAEGWFTGPALFDPGGWPDISLRSNTFRPITVKSGAGNNILVEFGYSEYGARDAYFCTARAEKCVAKAAAIDEASPFLYAGESGAYTAAASTVTIPALPGRVLHYRIRENGTWGPLQVLAIP